MSQASAHPSPRPTFCVLQALLSELGRSEPGASSVLHGGRTRSLDGPCAFLSPAETAVPNYCGLGGRGSGGQGAAKWGAEAQEEGAGRDPRQRWTRAWTLSVPPSLCLEPQGLCSSSPEHPPPLLQSPAPAWPATASFLPVQTPETPRASHSAEPALDGLRAPPSPSLSLSVGGR